MGSYGEALVSSIALKHNNSVFVDFGDNSKIDLIIEDSTTKLHKIQVKTDGRETKSPDVSILYLYKNGPNYRFKYEQSMVDWFALVDYITGKVAWVKFSDYVDQKKYIIQTCSHREHQSE